MTSQATAVCVHGAARAPKGSARRDEGSKPRERTGRPMWRAGFETDAAVDPTDRRMGHRQETETTMNPLQLETMAHDRQAERERTLASWALSRSTRPEWPPTPTPLPPLRPSPRLRAPRLAAAPVASWLHRLQALLVGAIAGRPAIRSRPRSYDRGHGRPDRHRRDHLPGAGTRGRLRGARHRRARIRQVPRPSRHQRRGGHRQDAPRRGAAPDGGSARLPRPVGVGHRPRRWRRAVRGPRRGAP